MCDSSDDHGDLFDQSQDGLLTCPNCGNDSPYKIAEVDEHHEYDYAEDGKINAEKVTYQFYCHDCEQYFAIVEYW